MPARLWISIACVACVLTASACSSEGDESGVGERDAVDQQTSSPEPTTSRTPARDPDFDPGEIAARLRPIAQGFEAPLLVTHAGDGTDRLFVVEQGGLIWVLEDGEVLDPAFLDITAKTEAGGEQGLLGLAFHPAYRRNGRLFVNYTDNDGNTVIAEYRGRRDHADPGSERVLLTINQPFPNHNGGGLAFGPDGYLYIGMGDGGSAGDPMGNGQNLNTLLGKLLRIDVDSRSGERPYGIPSDNPYVGRAGRDEIWASGLRNPWRFSFDDDALWIGDVGQNSAEEINRAPPDRAGINYGWNVTEGNDCYEIADCDKSELWAPLATYSHDFGCSVTGGYVYRGRAFPELVGGYFFADYCSGRMWAVDAAGPAQQQPVELDATGHSISSFGADERGELYATDLSSGRSCDWSPSKPSPPSPASGRIAR